MIHGGDELYRRLTEMADAGAAQSWQAQLNYLTRSQKGRDLVTSHFATPSDPSGRRIVLAWLAGPDAAGGRAPNPAKQAEIARLYRQQHRRNQVQALKKRLANEGRGTLIEVHPDPDIAARSGGAVRFAVVTIFGPEWDIIVDHWAANDFAGLAGDWQTICDRELYPPRGYYYISHLGF